MKTIQIKIRGSRILPVAGSVFYLSGYLIPWVLPWQNMRIWVFFLVVALSIPFLNYLLNSGRTNIKSLILENNKIISTVFDNGQSYPVKFFQVSRAFTDYMEIDLFFIGRKKYRLCIMRDMLDKYDLCHLKQLILTSYNAGDKGFRIKNQ